MAPASNSTNAIVQLLAEGKAVIGAFSSEHTMAGGREIMSGPRSDFQLYSMETGPFDVALMQEYFAGMVEVAGEARSPKPSQSECATQGGSPRWNAATTEA